MQRVIFKISGEALKGKESVFDINTLTRIAKEIIDISKQDFQIGIILGGGNVLRGNQAKTLGIRSVFADNVGMLATIQNAIIFSEVIISLGVAAKVYTTVKMDSIVPFYRQKAADEALNLGNICFFAGGLCNPFFSTDTAAVIRAIELNADLLLKGTKVDGIYSADPNTDKHAKFIQSVSYDVALTKNLNVMDMAAFSLARENGLEIRTFNMAKQGNIKRALIDKSIGSVIHK